MTKPIGGRGKKAPYQTTHYRIPEPIKPLVELLAEQYRNYVFEGDVVDFDSKALLPQVPAVYFVLEDLEIVYVGQTKSLLERWRSHHVVKRLEGLSGNISIAWLQCNEINLLPAIEKVLIDTLEPRLNAERWGRPSSWKNGATKTIRVPEHLADQVLEAAHKLDDAIAEKSKLQLELEQLRHERDQLDLELTNLKEQQQQQQELATPTGEKQNLEALRDRYLASLKLGRQAPKYKHSKAAIDWLIEQL